LRLYPQVGTYVFGIHGVIPFFEEDLKNHQNLSISKVFDSLNK